MVIVKIISRETIKPSSPTPSHLHTYNLSEMDILNPKIYIPQVLFYSNNSDVSLTTEQKATMLKKSLSLSLTRYYPFAGRLPTPASSFVDCNDEGVLFLEAISDYQLDTFQRMISPQDDDFDQLFVDDLLNYHNPISLDLVAVQLTHFVCGGLALAVLFSHVIGDACTLSSFLNYWAYVARYGSTEAPQVLPNNPHYIQSPLITQPPKTEFLWNKKPTVNIVSRNFMFPNSKLSELKNKVAGNTNNPTRVEVLTSLIFKTAVEAATAKNGCFKPARLICKLNVRNRFVPKLPQSTVGNFVKNMTIKIRHINEASISMLVAEIRKEKQAVEGTQSLQELVEFTKSFQAKLLNEDLENAPDEIYKCTSRCGLPFNKVDFGWGKPMGTPHAYKLRNAKNIITMMDTADGDGIEVVMSLEKECMDIFEKDKELLSYCQI